MKIGPTGDFPEGKLDETDEGGLTIAVTTWKGEVRIDFGKPVAWLAFPPEQAIQIAEVLVKRAREIQ